MRPVKLLILLFNLFTLPAFAQSAHIDYISKHSLDSAIEDSMPIRFPVVRTGKEAIDQKINGLIRIALIDFDSTGLSADSLLRISINEFGLREMQPAINLNKHGLLSLTVSMYGCGAYCSGWNEYLNFDLETGEALTISDMIEANQLPAFRDSLYAMKAMELDMHKAEMTGMLKSGEMDSVAYDQGTWEIDSVCMKELPLATFTLSDNALTLLDECAFAHVIMAYEPGTNEFTYSYTLDKGLFRKDFLKRMASKR